MTDMERKISNMLIPEIIQIHDGEDIVFNRNVMKQYFTLPDLLILKEKVNRSIKFAKTNDIEYLNKKLEEQHRLELKILYDNNSPTKKPARIGFLYMMYDSSMALIKIGYSRDPEFRVKTLQAHNPSLKLLMQWQSTMKFERITHQHFANKKVRGEWFNVTSNEVEAFVKLNQHRIHEN